MLHLLTLSLLKCRLSPANVLLRNVTLFSLLRSQFSRCVNYLCWLLQRRTDTDIGNLTLTYLRMMVDTLMMMWPGCNDTKCQGAVNLRNWTHIKWLPVDFRFITAPAILRTTKTDFSSFLSWIWCSTQFWVETNYRGVSTCALWLSLQRAFVPRHQ